MRKFWLFPTMLSLLSSPLVADKLYLLSNHENAGDHNQALGIESAVKELAPGVFTTVDLDTSKTTADQIKDKVAEDLQTQKVIVVGTGEGGLGGIKDLTRQKNLVITLASHMLLEGYENPDILNKIDYVALPSHVSPEVKNIFGHKLIETTGVSHNRNSDLIEKTYTEYKNELPDSSNYLVVMLGGDAPTPNKEIKHFTQEDAQKLAQHVIASAKKDKATVVVLNGPRTGKYDEKGKEIPTAHKDGKMDFVTTEFIKSLSAGLDSSNVKIFDFQFNQKPPYNSFDLVLGALKEKPGQLLIPGDSTSMISEAIDNLPKGKVLIYETGSMNEVHSAHVNSELKAGRSSLLQHYKTIKTAGNTAEASQTSAAKTIAQKLLDSGVGF